MDVTLPFEKLDAALRGESPISFGVMALRIRASLGELTKSEKRNLKEYANIENGIVERYLLVPGNITVVALEFAIDKCFGLWPEQYGAITLLDNDGMKRHFPTLGNILDNWGLLFEHPFDDKLIDQYLLSSESLENLMLIEGPFYARRAEVDSTVSAKLREKFKKEIEEGVEYNGEVISLRDVPAGLDTFDAYLNKDGQCSLTISPDVEVRELIAPKGTRLNTLDSFNSYLKKAIAGKDATIKPIARALDSIRYNDEGKEAFRFQVDIPSSIEFIIEEGHLSIEEYMDSVGYVTNTFLPDCIYKSGYDLYGKDARDYYEFIMNLHSGLPQFFHDIVRAAGWREPLLDYKRIMRE